MKKHLIIEKEATGLSDSKEFARNVAAQINADDTILFYGDLGSGKTFLIKEIVLSLGITTEVTSPSFSIINQYEGESSVFHIDLYRIKNKKEIINTGLEEILSAEAILCIEWPQIIEDEITWKHYRLKIETNQTDEFWRKLSLYRVN
jgi:tRNA threonylcarbamoyladenosine biosynthesis protein TsaE